MDEGVDYNHVNYKLWGVEDRRSGEPIQGKKKKNMDLLLVIEEFGGEEAIGASISMLPI